LGPMLGAHALTALRVALVTGLSVSVFILMTGRSRRRTLMSHAPARVVRVSGLSLPGWKPPPDSRPGALSQAGARGFDWGSAPHHR
jgi:hypothetical protein